jgi:hypothetical protein
MMRQKFDLTQTELDEAADKAVGLSDWLNQKAFALSTKTPIPLEVTIVASVTLTTGFLALMDGATPAGGCWGYTSGCKIG